MTLKFLPMVNGDCGLKYTPQGVIVSGFPSWMAGKQYYYPHVQVGRHHSLPQDQWAMLVCGRV